MKKNQKQWWLRSALGLGLAASAVLPSAVMADTDEDVVDLRLMETTDLHSHVMNYDYFSGRQDDKVGLVNTAALINSAREEVTNSMLFDNGDLIQGNPMADYVVDQNVLDEEGKIHPVYQAMNLLEYDAGNYGNHEFNYGLDFLSQAISGSDFPYVNANVYKADSEENYFDPYVILDREVIDQDGEAHAIKVGVIGFVPPQIMTWDKDKLEGHVTTRDLKETAEKFIPEMKEAGADVIVGIAHSGLGSAEEYVKGAENQTYQLSTVDGFDALLFGHSHQTFPSEDYASLDGKHNIDLNTGTINGVPTTQAGFWGSDLGIIDLQMEKTDGEWEIVQGKSEARPIYDSETGEALVKPDQEIIDAVAHDHEGTKEYVATPVGETEVPLYSYFSQVLDDPTVQVVNDAQKSYIEKYIQGTELDGLPVLSAAAPFKAGRDGVSDYTDIPAGGLAIKDTTSLYKYPNTVRAVKINGAQVIEWLEWSAGQFNQIDPDTKEAQQLVKENTSTEPGFPSYNFDVIDGLTYQIDVTEPARYNNDGDKINNSHRIVNVEFNGEPIDPDQEFLVATNNYRASSKFANPDGDNVVIESPDENRQVLVNYIRENETINPKADGNWSFAPIEGDVTLTFRSSPKGQEYAAKEEAITYLETQADGFAEYTVELSETPETEVSFPDVPEGYWAQEEIYELAKDGVIKGYPNGNFGPTDKLTRVQFAMLLTRELGLTAEGENPFKDVPEKYQEEVTAAFENGIVNGVASDRFDPEALINREQMAAMVVRAYEYKAGEDYHPSSDLPYEDQNQIRIGFVDEVRAAYELELMIGVPGDKFVPKGTASRAEAATVVYRLR
ncbi:bifunctional 2',3'-cyclic-nucleotide 2'-phosphodiesterase/3'-nucleotidase [Halobacillus trueperi]|uniref:bifunctional 2',3'-cyclic-nucleotide 2'-phosphodiesterase/3'-nucleotidase n=1 Tax=Halobacillus trueperi TaxID=156205 RepID=UPI003734C29B